MIKVGILGAENASAGELLRVLLNHPEVELMNAVAPSLCGKAVSSYHRGLIGETELRFSDSINIEGLDLLFITSPEFKVNSIEKLPENLRVILLQGKDRFDVPSPFDKLEFVPGVSEMFRKKLVRGAMAARILPSATSLILITLYPLASHLLLNDTLRIYLQVPFHREKSINIDLMRNEVEGLIREVQLSMNSLREIKVEVSDTIRALSAEIEFECGIAQEEIERIYQETYEDHHFTFLVKSDPSPSEVAGTHKCLIYVSKPTDNKLRIKAVADSVLRGGAGDAIHSMNLLFGLFEKTGLSLPAGLAFNDELLNRR